MPPVATVIMPMDRPGADARRAVDSVLEQRSRRPFELLVVAPERGGLADDPKLRWLPMEERNPAIRRNAAAAASEAKYLAFIDDDAFADPAWLETAIEYLETHPGVVAIGGPDPAPPDSSVAELVSDTLLATPWIGSGIAAHEARPGTFAVRRPWDLALVNLIMRKEVFDRLGGFRESIGYIGEDTELLSRMLGEGTVVYHDGIVVHHRRRRFPGAYLRQRWRYRVKTGERLVLGGALYRTRAVAALLAAGATMLVLLVLAPAIALGLVAVYLILVTALAIPSTRLPAWLWPLIGPAFLLHHGTYFFGVIAGIGRGLARRVRGAGNQGGGGRVRDLER
ncbi:MAG: glycosyltransferase [Thermoanaerobaculia bacterium]